MQINLEQNKLTLTYFPRIRLALQASFGIALLGFMAYRQWQGTLTQGDIIGISVGLVITVGVVVAMHSRNTFVFDKNTQTVTWQKQRIWSTNSGQAAFSDISAVKVEHYVDAETQGWRPILIVGTKEIPMVDIYVHKEKDAKHIAEQINDFLGRKQPASKV